MTDAVVGVTNQTAGTGVAEVDVSQVTVAGQPVVRQRLVIADPVNATGLAGVTAGGALQVDGSAVVQPMSATTLPLPTGAAADGVDITAAVMPTGGVGIRGWLSAIFAKLSASIAVTGTFWQQIQPVSIAGNATGAITTVAASITSGKALDANANRKGAVYVNDPLGTAGATAYLAFLASGEATTTSYSYKIAPNQTLELVGEWNFTGRERVIWSAANGALLITEITV